METPLRPFIVLAAVVACFALVFGVRGLLHRRRTGSWGFRGISGPVGSAGWWGGVLFALSAGLTLVAPALAIARVDTLLFEPTMLSDALAYGLAGTGVAGTWWAQSAMGDSWRVGVRASEQTTLVSSGPFRWVRNPVFSFLIVALLGLLLALPSASLIAALACMVAAVELQVRFVEEPYLLRTHGGRYRVYCQTTGRFLPWWTTRHSGH